MSIREIRYSYLVSVALLCAAPAYAQDADKPAGGPVALQLLEPVRFALVIGNGEYSQGGMLQPIGTACTHDPDHPDPLAASDPPGDVDVVADAFTTAGWKVTKRCNLTHVELGEALQDFVDMVGDTDRAFGIVYFSGHGAQIAGHNYLFGVNANFNAQAVAAKYKINHRAILFGNSAVDLESVLGRYPGMSAKGVVVVIDACRDNPVLDQMRDLDVDLQNLRFPGSDNGMTGVVMSFASSAGRQAPAGVMGHPTKFASELAAAIQGAKAPALAEIEPLLQTINDKIAKATHGAQTPRKIGDLHRPPAFCISGCASAAADWVPVDLSYDQQLTRLEDNGLRRLSAWQPEGQWLSRWASLDASSSVEINGRLVRRLVEQDQPAPLPSLAPPASAPAANSALAPTTPVPTRAPAPATVSAAASPASDEEQDKRDFAFDIYWCSGDAMAESRHGKAIAIKAAIDQQFRGNALPHPGYGGVATRLIGLPVDLANRNHVNGFLIRINADSQAERIWGKATIDLLYDKPRALYSRSGAPDRISIFVCNNLGSERTIDDVYFQVPSKDQIAPLTAIKADLGARVPDIHVVTGTQAMGEKSPNATQIRYFFPEQQANANAVADELQRQLGHPVTVQLTRGFEKALAGRRVIEVWVGKNETGSAVMPSAPAMPPVENILQDPVAAATG